MKRVLEHIDRKSKALELEPVFVHLRNRELEPVERLRFVPCTTHFIMTFADLCRFVLPSKPPKDRFEELANANLAEEADHWKWFLADLSSLDLDPNLRFTDSVRFLWGEASLKARQLSYEICKVNAHASTIERLVIVLSIEATGKVALEASQSAGREAADRLGRNLVYFGPHHLDSELSHTLAEHDVKGLLSETVLDEATTKSLCGLVDRIFELFQDFLRDTYAFVQRGGGFAGLGEGAKLATGDARGT